MEKRHLDAILESLGTVLSEKEMAMLPRRYELVGDIMLLHLPESLMRHSKEIALAYMDAVGVVSVMGKQAISGEYRRPSHTLLAGTRTVAVHRENGISYELDLSKLMFSSGNINERIRMSRVHDVGPVVDMFAGIGYFTLPLAKHAGCHVVALEKNPVSYGYLCRNVVRNGVEGLVETVHTDCRDYCGHAMRIMMGYVGTTDMFLPKAFEMADDGCIVHFHNTVPSDTFKAHMEHQIRTRADAEEGVDVCILGSHVVKKYSPGIVHAVTDFLVEKST